MILRGLLIGLFAAAVVVLPRVIWHRIALDWAQPGFLIGVGAAVGLLAWFFIDRKRDTLRSHYFGVADLLAQVHSNPTPDASARWGVRGVISFLLGLFGANTGAEGAAIELSHGFAVKSRNHSSHWFEQLRRTDAASAVSGGVAAAFGAPFAAVLLPVELGLGGRTLSVVISAVAAVLLAHYATLYFGLPTLDLTAFMSSENQTPMLSWLSWASLGGVLAAAVTGGVVGRVLIEFIRYTRKSFDDFFGDRAAPRLAVGAVILAMVALAYTGAHVPPFEVAARVFGGEAAPAELGLLFLALTLTYSVVAGVFGTAGMFWPVFLLGSILGAGVALWVGAVPLLTILCGASAFFGAVLGAPLAGGLLAYEMTGEAAVLLPCLAAGLFAKEMVRFTRGRTLVERDLETQGIVLEDGRSLTVLDSVYVREAMVTDHAQVHEHDSVADVYERLLASKYPFLPVLNAKGGYTGLLTADMVEEAWESQEKAQHSNVPLTKLLEAKDLLYRSGQKIEPIHVDDRLTVTVGAFGNTPVLPVVGEDRKVMGLLFNYNVRIAYDREVARRALFFRHDGKIRVLEPRKTREERVGEKAPEVEKEPV